jgi:hypothetical protein
VLVCLVKYPNFDLLYSISFLSHFMFDEFITKGGQYGHKVDWTLANRVVERRNMINMYLRERACIESVRGSWFSGSFEFCELFLALLYHFDLVCRFSCILLVLCLFLLLYDLLELFIDFWSSSYAHGVLNLRFKLYVFCCQWTHQGGDWEIKYQYLGLICDESLTCRCLNLDSRHFDSFTFIIWFVWRITFACLIVCRW